MFPASGYRIKVNGEHVDVYEFVDVLQAWRAVRAVGPDGSSISPSQGIIGLDIEWVMPPHWYHKGQLIVLYVGENSNLKATLAKLLGAEFARPE